MKKLLFSFAFLLSFSSLTWAATYTVGTDKTYTTIAACAAVAVAGDTCEVYDGSYAGFTTGSGSAGGGYITYTAAAGNSPSVTGNISVLGKSYVIINGFTFPTTQRITGFAYGTRGSYLKITNNTWTNSNIGNAFSIYLNHDYVLIDGNTVQYIGGSSSSDGFLFIIGHYITVRNNTIWEGLGSTSVHLDFFQSWGESSAQKNLQDVLIENNSFLSVANSNTHYFLDNSNTLGVEPCTRIIIRYNKVYAMGSPYFAMLDNNSAVVSTKNVIYNNTLVSNSESDGTYVNYNRSTYSTSMNNIIKNSLSSPAYGAEYTTTGWSQSYNLYDNASHNLTFGGAASSEVGAVKNQDPLIADPASNDFSISSISPAKDKGGPLTTVHADDTGSGTALIVTKSEFFQYGQAPDTDADWIAVGTVGNVAQISSINYTTNVITLSSALTRSDGDSVWLYKDSDGTVVLYGTAPDIGAYEYTGTTPPSATGCTIQGATPGQHQCAEASWPVTPVTMACTTDMAATCKYDDTDTTYALMDETFDTTGTTSHSESITVNCGQSYTYYVRCSGTGGAATTSYPVSFSIDKDPPPRKTYNITLMRTDR